MTSPFQTQLKIILIQRRQDPKYIKTTAFAHPLLLITCNKPRTNAKPTPFIFQVPLHHAVTVNTASATRFRYATKLHSTVHIGLYLHACN